MAADDVFEAFAKVVEKFGIDLDGLIKPRCPKCKQAVVVTLSASAKTNNRRVNVCLSCNHSWKAANSPQREE